MFRVKRLLILHDQANANEPRSPVQIGEFGVDEISIGVIAFSDGPKNVCTPVPRRQLLARVAYLGAFVLRFKPNNSY